ncbi:MAG: esterase family protein [Cytophagales bacterium]|nr:esterase family protein [Armatimonadota bacterium]
MALCTVHYFSSALGRQTAANVLLPEVGTPPYPVLYLLHGLSDDYTLWGRRSNIERHVAEVPLIVVMPDGGRGFYSDAVAGEKFQTALAVELVDRIDRTFPTHAAREGRSVAGLSMGGYGAMKFAFTYPERFHAAVSLSGAVGWGNRTTGRNQEPMSEEWLRILGPGYRGGPNDLHALAEKADPATLPALRIDCGVEDFLIADNREFHAHLDTLGISHEYAEHPGSHNWDYWDLHVQDAIAFHKKALGF